MLTDYCLLRPRKGSLVKLKELRLKKNMGDKDELNDVGFERTPPTY
jgi:hypothetical protein